MSIKTLKTYISIVNADCEEFGGIMNETNDNELNNCSLSELKLIKEYLIHSLDEIDERIEEKIKNESYEKGLSEGKYLILESLEENI